MGVEQVTIMNLDVVKVDAELNMIVVRGAIPGPKGAAALLSLNSFRCFLGDTPALSRWPFSGLVSLRSGMSS